jgi:hypothetical protein
MLTVDGTPKKQKQKAIWKRIRSEMPLFRLFRLFWKGWRTVK